MPRLPLIHIPNGIYSVVSKCNNNEFLFDADEKFELYLEHLLECKKKLGFTLFDICCMSNHVHELYRVPDNGVTIANILQMVKGGFTQKFNPRFGRSGHFWKNKPFWRIVENERYAFHCINYFHWNPVAAGLVDHPEKWPYSGYRFHMLGIREGLIGKLLTPLSKVDPATELQVGNESIENETRAALCNLRTRVIGCQHFVDYVRCLR